jgi:limonene-1,2-epoxide hydrolase
MQMTTTATQSRSERHEEEDIAVVEAFFAAFAARDTERALALMSEDIVYQNVPFPADRGKAAVARTLQAFGHFVSGFEVKMRNIAARNGVVLTERVDTLTGPLLYLDLWVCGTFEVRDGRITLWRDYFDLASATVKLIVSPIRSLLGAR